MAKKKRMKAAEMWWATYRMHDKFQGLSGFIITTDGKVLKTDTTENRFVTTEIQ